MKAAVFDTYVKRPDARIMHFDIIVPDNIDFEQVQTYGKAYLKAKGLSDLALTTEECKFCHIEQASPELESSIEAQGYSIIELGNCDESK